MQFSYWEKSEILGKPDLIIIGSGIVGLSSAISFKEKYPNKKVWVLERGVLPTGGSTKNAGFACFGSASELLDDMKSMSEDEVFQTVERRYKGLDILLNRLGKEAIEYLELGSHELFLKENEELYYDCMDALSYLNQQLSPITGFKKTYIPEENISKFGFNGVQWSIKTLGEGQINTGKMMVHLLKYAREKDIQIFNSVSVNDIEESDNHVTVECDMGRFKTPHLIIATNGFSKHFLPEVDIQPTRAQVLITTPVSSTPVKGIFHLDRGYYYFRNVGDRILLGGGRQKDTAPEMTDKINLNEKIQADLKKLMREVILPNEDYMIEHQWAGIMGMGEQKSPIVKKVSDRVVCGIRLGGMGVAMGSLIGQQLANLSQ